ncbi:histidinol-phosphatase [Acidihalobacter prosperus]|uniref:Phosphoserine phosphatase n=1 Tax=Acidihalobacter prosperus TaxID=160660 RepID=A0A1A6C3J0_9GAMM|nr:HAD family hydrolase [Acidihalobacter prosperus]OBS09124.1 Phosphoserine phosphatase [Acidihalobacter prosperus]
MGLALFDLDHTLLNGDSDHEWARFLMDEGIVDREANSSANEQFYADYTAGTLDIHAFARFAFAPLAAHPLQALESWRARYLQERIEPMIGEQARALVSRHREAGDTLVLITATNSFVTRPIADLFDIEHLIATEPKRIDGRFVAEIEGTPAFREGKVARLQAWLASRPDLAEAESWFYSDSHNDLPLLERVDHPVAVNPDTKLAAVADARGWPILNLRDSAQPKLSAKA